MCGICSVLCSLGQNYKQEATDIINHEIEQVKTNITRRGPDSQEEIISSEHDIGFFSSVLHIRGDEIVKQPLIDNNGNILLWNGEVYDGIDIQSTENDTKKILQLLSSTQTNICDAMECVEGEWSFIYLNKNNNRLYFGRDKCGRRSLLLKISEITKENHTYYCVSLSSTGYSLPESTELISSSIMDTSIFDMSQLDPTPEPYSIHYLNKWIELPPFGVYSIDLNDYINKNQLYINLDSWKNSYNRVLLDEQLELISQPYEFPNFPSYLVDTAQELNIQLYKSVSKRLFYTSTKEPGISILFSGGIDCSLVAALTSSILPESFYIELINVSFDKPFYNSPDRRTALNSYIDLKSQFPHRKFHFICVDISLEELFHNENHILDLIYPKTSTMDVHIAAAFHFASRGIGNSIEDSNIDISTLKELMEYDKNLKYAESIECPPEPGYISLLKPYVSKCKIILSGTGADELFGGYTRHYAAYTKEGWKGLDQVLQMEYSRLWIRNLGRDDRAISDNGKEIRFPFLDEQVISFTYKQPIYKLIDPRLPKGEGDKIILRVMCTFYNLHSCLHLSKRAIQFGSRIVKQLNLLEGKNSRQTKGHITYVKHQVNY